MPRAKQQPAPLPEDDVKTEEAEEITVEETEELPQVEVIEKKPEPPEPEPNWHLVEALSTGKAYQTEVANIDAPNIKRVLLRTRVNGKLVPQAPLLIENVRWHVTQKQFVR